MVFANQHIRHSTYFYTGLAFNRSIRYYSPNQSTKFAYLTIHSVIADFNMRLANNSAYFVRS